MNICLFCGDSQRDYLKPFCNECGSKWKADELVDQSDQVTRYCSTLFQVVESTSDSGEGKQIKTMRERFKISHKTHTKLFQELIGKLKVAEELKTFEIYFNENVTDAYAGHDTFLRFKFINTSASEQFKVASLYWDDPEAPDHLDFRTKSQAPIKPKSELLLQGNHIFNRVGPKQINEMKLTVENIYGDSAEFLIDTFTFKVGNPDQKVVNNITTHTQISIEGRGVVDASGIGADKSSNQDSNLGLEAPVWVKLNSRPIIIPPENISNYTQQLQNINKVASSAPPVVSEEIEEATATSRPSQTIHSNTNQLVNEITLREAAEKVFKYVSWFSELAPTASAYNVVGAAHFSLNFLSVIFSQIPDLEEDSILGMVFEDGETVVEDDEESIVNFVGNACVFTLSGVTIVTNENNIVTGQVHYSWGSIKSNSWGFYKRRFGDNSYIISFGDSASSQNLPGCKFDLRRYKGDLSLDELFDTADKWFLKLLDLAPEELEEEELEEEELEEEELEEEELEEEAEPVAVDNSAWVEIDSRMQRFFGLLRFAIQKCIEDQPKSIFIESDIDEALLDNLYESVFESGTGMSIVCLEPHQAELSFNGKLIGWKGPASVISTEGIFHMTSTNGKEFVLDGSNSFLSWEKFFGDYKGDLIIREAGPDLWFGTLNNILIRGGYVDYSVNVLQWDYFEEFIQNDLLNALALFREAADLI